MKRERERYKIRSVRTENTGRHEKEGMVKVICVHIVWSELEICAACTDKWQEGLGIACRCWSSSDWSVAGYQVQKCGEIIIHVLHSKNASVWNKLLFTYFICKDLKKKKQRCGTGKVYSGFWWGELRERNHLENFDVDRRIILKWILKKWDGEAWTGLVWLRIGAGGWRLWMREWTFGFHKMLGHSWLAEDLLASQEGLCSMNLVS